nr:hypothetical protein CFP56_32170 [Quercus suber]
MLASRLSGIAMWTAITRAATCDATPGIRPRQRGRLPISCYSLSIVVGQRFSRVRSFLALAVVARSVGAFDWQRMRRPNNACRRLVLLSVPPLLMVRPCRTRRLAKRSFPERDFALDVDLEPPSRRPLVRNAVRNAVERPRSYLILMGPASTEPRPADVVHGEAQHKRELLRRPLEGLGGPRPETNELHAAVSTFCHMLWTPRQAAEQFATAHLGTRS